MAKGKGKKAWAKIDVRDVEDAHAGAAAIAAAGGPIEELPNDSLFFVDTEKDEGMPPWDLGCDCLWSEARIPADVLLHAPVQPL